MSRTVVFLNPRCANSAPAMRSSSSRRVGAAAEVEPVETVMRGPRGGLSGARSVGGCPWGLAAHGDDLTGQVGRVVAGKEHHDVCDLPRLGCATECLALLEVVQQLVGG